MITMQTKIATYIRKTYDEYSGVYVLDPPWQTQHTRTVIGCVIVNYRPGAGMAVWAANSLGGMINYPQPLILYSNPDCDSYDQIFHEMGYEIYGRDAWP